MEKSILGWTGKNLSINPVKYKWAIAMYNNMRRNDWTHQSVPTATDLSDWKDKLSESERTMVRKSLAFLSAADVVALDSVATILNAHINAVEINITLASIAAQEGEHTLSYQHTLESIGLSPGEQTEVYNLYKTNPAIKAKLDFALDKFEDASKLGDELRTKEDIMIYLKTYFFFSIVFEGIWFMAGFTPLLNLSRRGIMKGMQGQIKYIWRDECLTPDHEVLTPGGWKFINEVKKGEEVLTYDKETSLSGFDNIIETTEILYTGTQHTFESSSVSQVTTDNHRMIHWEGNGDRTVTMAKDIPDGENSINIVHQRKPVNDESRVEWYTNGGVVTKTSEEVTDVPMHCLTVVSGFFIVRHNGKISVTGNSLHTATGLQLIRGICEEEQVKLDPKWMQDTVRKAHDLELDYIVDILGEGIEGYSVEEHMQQIRYFSNLRLKNLNVNPIFEESEILPWTRAITGSAESAFFEVHNQDYQVNSGIESTFNLTSRKGHLPDNIKL